MHKHTPGPWYHLGITYLERRDTNILGRSRPETGRVHIATVHLKDESINGYEANVKLIESSPTMLETLEWIEEIALATYEQDEKLRANGARTLLRIAEKARQTIDLATGKESSNA